MAGRFEGTTVVARPIEEVFAFLANGENDVKFSPRVQEIRKITDGPIGVGTRVTIFNELEGTASASSS